MILSMVPITELRGAIPIGMALKLNPIGVYLSSVIGSTLVAIPLVLAYRHVVKFFKEKNMFLFLYLYTMSASLFWNILFTKLLVYFSISSAFSFAFIAWFISDTASSFLSNIVLNILSCLFVIL